mmetsp:Transcript_747/g.2177  ORF Transcript_747/g.2177 Transcript_747/m.2177 type:complete len:641 (+) Transcript_747:108-2030(+)
MPVFGAAPGGGRSWKRRLKHFVGLQVRQVPCLHAIVHNIRCWKRQQYQVLGEDEEGNVLMADDRSQGANAVLGQCMVTLGLLCMVGITAMFYVTSEDEPPLAGAGNHKDLYREEFRQDSPIILYMGAIEILLCGACAHTAALMFKRRRHAIKHPAESSARERQCYIKVELEKDTGVEGSQLYGLGYRPSTDGLECLLVEAVRRGSILDQWNHPAPDDFVIDDGDIEVSQPSFELGQVLPGSAIVAVNDVAADIGMMQLQLTMPKVTMWIRSEVIHPSQLDTEILAAQSLDDETSYPAPQTTDSTGSAAGTSRAPPAFPSPTVVGQGGQGASPSRPTRATGPRCACIAFEDEEPQILTRWTICSILGGWITLLPVLLMQPHEERPRQKLFRQYLLRPCCFILPVWIFLWLMDTVEVLLQVEILRPFYYFAVVHMLFPAVVVWYLLQMQAGDEKLVLEQRRARAAEANSAVPVVVEDPSPTLLKELITVNPIALILIGATASLPIVVSCLLTPLETERGRKAKGYVINMYGPLIVVQVMMAYFMYHVPFVLLPRVYLACIGLLLSLPCLLTCCCCLMCSSCYDRNDLLDVRQQRLDRAKEADQRARPGEAPGAGGPAQGGSADDLVDCAVAQQREWELIYTA